ncbi:hypothetical protein KFK14_19695 [Sphingobium phenoxybenzoativorans]|uniref:Uncharacterized protein n=1 Tax=Sphingobium phenoxybenzoativorans TaxID=1592790 RepID=A0A975K5K1_9SPHN|nr:hypothetical protein [Sphingobium phenoxybenzoativorans]QUT05196.1 hypothetical protein KFK14_19695 [Sphingobium phenoxybenzoativorans]
MDYMDAFHAGQKATIDRNERIRMENARKATSDYFQATHRPGIMSMTVEDNGTNLNEQSAPAAQQLAQIGMQGQMAQQDALNRVAQYDPDRAFKLEAIDRAARKEQLELEYQLNGMAMRELVGVHDQATYDAATRRARRVYARHGVDFDSFGLPSEYDPDVVRDLRLRTLAVDKQFAAELGRERFEHDAQDDDADNARADLETEDRIADRAARRDLTARNINLADARGRRGQDIASADRRRGQDMTDRRIRENPPSRSSQSARPPAGTKPPKISSPADLARLKKGDLYEAPDGSIRKKS